MAIEWKRPLSAFITSYMEGKAALNSRAYNSETAMIITLKDNNMLRYATKNLTMDSISLGTASVPIAATVFAARLEGIPDLRDSQGKPPDAGDFEIINLDYVISAGAPDEDRVFDNATVTVYLCFPKQNGNYEGVIIFNGLIADIQSDDETADMSIISKLSSAAAVVGKEITQRCLNELGDEWCGVPVGTLPVGAICSKLWNDFEAGCKYWGGVFNGISFINPNGTVNGYTGTLPNGGFDTGGGIIGCPDYETSWFESANGGYIHAKDIKAGEAVTDHKGDIVLIEHAEIMHVPARFLVRTRYGADIIVSTTHKFITGLDDAKGKFANSWRFSQYDLVCKTPETGIVLAEHVADLEKDVSNYSFRPLGEGQCLRLSVSGSQIYPAGMTKGKMLYHHNNKWHPTPITV